MSDNGVLFQFFQWHSNNDGSLWQELERSIELLKDLNISAVWIPPAYKGSAGIDDQGYAVYDLFDLGEFDQKQSVRTKYGTRTQLESCINKLKRAGIHVYADVVLNHKDGADETEEIEAVEVHQHDRTQPASQPYKIKAWTKFNFPGRQGKYSEFEWNSTCFTSVDCNADAPGENKLYLLNGKSFGGDVSLEFGNFDYLMGCDVDVSNEAVREELFFWGRWFVDVTKVDGFRLDAVKHIPAVFYRDFFNHIRTHFGGRELLGIGEYWSGDLAELQNYLAQVDGVMKLFDVPLHFRFVAASKSGNNFDLRTIFDSTLTQADPLSSVTFVDNHDTQPGQSLESWVDDWFKPIAYALILLRQEGYPCVFYPDFFGSNEEQCTLSSHKTLLTVMLHARARYSFGDQHDYFDHENCIAWVRTGNEEHPGSLVVVASNGDAGRKRLNCFSPGGKFKDLTNHLPDEIVADESGEAEFLCPPGSVSVWAQV